MCVFCIPALHQTFLLLCVRNLSDDPHTDRGNRFVLTTISYLPSRRRLLTSGVSALSLIALSAIAPPLRAQPASASGQPFDFDSLCSQMERAAAEPFEPYAGVLPDVLSGLDYDAYRLIQYRNDKTKWVDADHAFGVQAFHPGWLYPETVDVFEVADGVARPLDFSSDDFQYRDAHLSETVAAMDFPGVAGVRFHHPMASGGNLSELASFLGASYFRALGRGNAYGLSARGVAINTWTGSPEEFPRFTAFYLEQPRPGEPLVFYAALDGESLTGAFRFTLLPADENRQETAIEVNARFYARKDIAEIGIAPLTSMFLFSEINRADFDDYRPQVHDSNALIIERNNGEVLFRPLANGGVLGNSYLTETDPVAFGLYQRDRAFSDYEDAGAAYHKRPSARIEPIGEWGEGLVRLVEIPAQLEADDNIVAFWIPAAPVKAGQALSFDYRIIWGDLDPDLSAPLANVVGTRAGAGGVAGVAPKADTRKFVIDFAGDALELPSGTSIDLFASAANGRIVHSTVSRLPDQGIWRAVLDVEASGGAPVELKAYLIGTGRVLTETWLFQWRPEA